MPSDVMTTGLIYSPRSDSGRDFPGISLLSPYTPVLAIGLVATSYPPVGHIGGRPECVSRVLVLHLLVHLHARRHLWDLNACFWGA